MDEQAKHERQLPWDEHVRVPLPADAGFTPQEHWAWARIVRGARADMRFFPKDDLGAQSAGEIIDDDGGGDDPTAATEWLAHRELSARFLSTILFHDPWKSARTRQYVRISHARFTEEIDWENQSLAGEIELSACLFERDVVFRRLSVGLLLDLQASRLEGRLSAAGLVVGGDMFCRGGFSVGGVVRLIGARIDGDLDFTGAKLAGSLEADRITIGGGLFCGAGFVADKEIRILGAHIGGNATFSGAKFGGDLYADSFNVSGTVFFSDGFTTSGDVRVLGAHVGSDLTFTGANVPGTIHGDGVSVAGNVFLRSMAALGAADLLAAHVGQNLQLGGSAIVGLVDLTGAEIKGELSLATSNGPRWGAKAKLALRNAKAGALAGALDAFRRGKSDFVSCDLAGFSYDRIGGVGAGTKGSTLASASGHDLRTWLRCCRPRDHFDPAPYRTLARALDDAGRKDRAADVRNALGNYELVAPGTPMMQRVMLALSWLFIGYGERNHRALLWFVTLVLAAATVGYWNELQPAWNALPGWTNRQAWADWIGFAFGDAVPVVTIDEAHKTFLADRFCGADSKGACARIPDGLTGFYYVVKVFGFVILSYLAAGLSGLAQRKE